MPPLLGNDCSLHLPDSLSVCLPVITINQDVNVVGTHQAIKYFLPFVKKSETKKVGGSVGCKGLFAGD